MKNKNKNSGLLWFLFFILLLAEFFGLNKVFAQNEKVIITEVMFKPEMSSTREWVEIYNNSGKIVNLDGWVLFENGIDHKLVLKQGSFDLGIGEYAIIANDADIFLQDYPDYSETLIDSSFSLNDSGEELIIKNNDKIAEYEISYKYDSIGKGFSLELKEDGTWEPSFEKKGTPGEKNSEKQADVSYPSHIKITELWPNPSSGEEFAELYNFGTENINLDGWKIKDKGGYTCNLSGKILADEYLEINEIEFSNCTIALNNDEEIVSLYNPKNEDPPVSQAKYSEDVEKDYSWSLFGSTWKWTLAPTPGKENELREKNKEETGDNNNENVSYNIIINEILPNPKGDEENKEYIELLNGEDFKIDLSGWILKDKTTKKYIFPEGTKIEPGKFLIIYRKDFRFAMNNSQEETVYLLNPSEKTIFSVSYNKTKENASYNFDGSDWHWSRFLTPGKKNKFNNLPEISKKKDNKIYVNVYADFSAKGYDKDKDNLKFSWDFGDGHKSYKKETRHKYKKAGKYKVALKVSDGSEDKIETFNIKVNKFPKRSVKIVSVSPNPKGKDSENEFIVVKNNSTKKVNLKDWSIATGSKKMINHPIREDLVIKPGKTAIITRNDSKFSLGNKKSKVELRYPDGKAASKLKYDKKKESVKEDEIYTEESRKWSWVAPETETKLAVAVTPEKNVGADFASAQEPEIILAAGKNFSEDKSFAKYALADFGKPQGIVLGSFTNRTYAPMVKNENSYLKIVFTALNSTLNYLLNKFFGF